MMFNNFKKKFSRRNIVFGLCIAAFLLFVTDTLFFHFGKPVVEYRDDVSLCERYFLEFPEGDKDVEISSRGEIEKWLSSNGLFIDYGDTVTVGDLEFRIKRVPVEFHDKMNPVNIDGE